MTTSSDTGRREISYADLARVARRMRPADAVVILRLYNPDAGPLSLNELLRFLKAVKSIHEACAWMGHDLRKETQNLAQGSLFDPDRRRTPKPPHLVVRDVRVGSLWVELIQEGGRDFGAGTTIWMVARVLRKGPGQLYEWAGLLGRARAERLRQQADAEVERARLHEIQKSLGAEQRRIFRAHQGLIQLKEDAPSLEVSVVDEQGEELPEPQNLFASKASVVSP